MLISGTQQGLEYERVRFNLKIYSCIVALSQFELVGIKVLVETCNVVTSLCLSMFDHVFRFG